MGCRNRCEANPRIIGEVVVDYDFEHDVPVSMTLKQCPICKEVYFDV
jgi:hypothetical protein